jgi:ribonuclease HI
MGSGIVVATDGSLKKSGAMGAAYVAKDNRGGLGTEIGQPSSIRPELTGIALALEDCPGEEDLNIITDSLSSMRLLKNMQRQDFPLQLYRHTVRQLLLRVTKLINTRAESGRATRFIKVRAHRVEPLNEEADALAAAAAESDPARPWAMDQDPEAVYFLYREAWVEWDARVREDLGATSGEALCHSHSPAEARADGRGGLASYASSHGSLDAPAESGLEHAGSGVGGDAHLHG